MCLAAPKSQRSTSVPLFQSPSPFYLHAQASFIPTLLSSSVSVAWGLVLFNLFNLKCSEERWPWDQFGIWQSCQSFLCAEAAWEAGGAQELEAVKLPLSSRCDNVPSSCGSARQALSPGTALQEEPRLSLNDSAPDCIFSSDTGISWCSLNALGWGGLLCSSPCAADLSSSSSSSMQTLCLGIVALSLWQRDGGNCRFMFFVFMDMKLVWGVFDIWAWFAH